MSKDTKPNKSVVAAAPVSQPVETVAVTKSEVTVPVETAAKTLAVVPAPQQMLEIPDGASPRTRLEIQLSNAGAKDHRMALKMMDERPTQEALLNTVDALPAEFQSKVMDIIRRANPKKPGMHMAKTGFSPITVKVNQGTGKDPARPAKSVPGDFYTGDSRMLENKIDGLVIGVQEGRVLWPEKGGDGDSKSPICVSMDRKKGSLYGDCGSCYYEKKSTKDGGCGLGVTVYFIDRDFTGIYALQFTKTSFGAGAGLARVLSQQEKPWARWVRFEANERVEGDKRWFVVKAMPISDPKTPSNEKPPAELDALLSSLSAIIDYDVYFPAVVDTYERAKNAASSQAGLPGGEHFNDKLLGSGTGKAPDFSGGV